MKEIRETKSESRHIAEELKNSETDIRIEEKEGGKMDVVFSLGEDSDCFLSVSIDKKGGVSINNLKVSSYLEGFGIGTELMRELANFLQNDMDRGVEFISGFITDKGALRILEKVFGKDNLIIRPRAVTDETLDYDIVMKEWGDDEAEVYVEVEDFSNLDI